MAPSPKDSSSCVLQGQWKKEVCESCYTTDSCLRIRLALLTIEAWAQGWLKEPSDSRDENVIIQESLKYGANLPVSQATHKTWNLLPFF